MKLNFKAVKLFGSVFLSQVRIFQRNKYIYLDYGHEIIKKRKMTWSSRWVNEDHNDA